jgi:hypothetical protein
MVVIVINYLNIIIFFHLMFGLVRFLERNGYNALTLNGDYVDYAYSGY